MYTRIVKLILLLITLVGSSIIGLKIINTLITYVGSFSWLSIGFIAISVMASFIGLGLLEPQPTTSEKKT